MDITDALDRLEIQAVLWTYARGVDRSDLEALSSVYHDDATDHHSNFSGPAREFARLTVERDEQFEAVGQHHITNIVIRKTGPDDAKVESYFLAFHPYGDPAASKLGIAAGRYLDHFQRRRGQWKIASRRVVMDWTRADVEGPPLGLADGRPDQGRRRASADVSYQFFGADVHGADDASGVDEI